MPAIAHVDDIEVEVLEVGPMRGHWRDLATAAGSVEVGVVRGVIAPGARSTPVHRHGREEEFVVVLQGSGLSWQDGTTFAIGPGDCVLHRAEEEAHTLMAGPDGLDVLVYGPREADEATHLPHAQIVRIGGATVAALDGPHPWEREVAAGDLPMPDGGPSPRPAGIVALADVPEEPDEHGHHAYVERDFGELLGSRTTGLRHVTIPAGREGIPPHCHAVEEELFVVLGGEGSVWLGEAEHPVRAGSVVARPAGTGVCHHFEAGADADLVYLAYGQRRRGEIVFYARSGVAYLKGVRRLVATEPMRPYWDFAS